MTKNYFFARVFTARLFPSERTGQFLKLVRHARILGENFGIRLDGRVGRGQDFRH